MKIIGITGTIGAGKTTVSNYLKENKDYIHLNVRDFLSEKLKDENIEINRDNMRDLGNKLRAENSPSFIVEQLYEKAKKLNENCVIESIRCVGEIIALQNKKDFILLGIDCDKKIRYERILKRGEKTDKIDFAKFCLQELAEMENIDINKQNLKKCIEMANFHIINNSSLSNLQEEIDKIIK